MTKRAMWIGVPAAAVLLWWLWLDPMPPARPPADGMRGDAASSAGSNASLATVQGGAASPAGSVVTPGPDGPAPGSSEAPPLASKVLVNRHAYIPPQCYTRTQDDDGRVHNPCYVCHARSRPPTYVSDADLQLAYSFARPARVNAWQNLFVDRRAAIAATSDADILAYVREDNYHDAEGRIALADRLTRDLPAAWDEDGDGRFGGYVPDAAFRFDDRGFDRDASGRATGWRAFGYYPFPGTFWPTNGSAGDVLIRLPEPFRQGADGREDLVAYAINLAVTEALITRRSVPIEPADERRYGVDLDRDGRLAVASQVTYDPAPGEGHAMGFVGRARSLQEAGEIRAVKGLFPRGTAFLHSVRYLDVRDGQVVPAARMKELRYAEKRAWLGPLELDDRAAAELKEKSAFPDRLRTLLGGLEGGVDNGQGWRFQGFIEDARGALRPQTFEESVFCVGCHGGIGATTDSTFAFARKLGPDTRAKGWFHWSQRGLSGLPEPVRADGRHEYTLYLEQNGAGDELRDNREVLARFFDGAGRLVPEAVSALHADIGTLLLPSPARALALDKAYLEVVREQSYRRGRQAVLAPAAHVHRELRPGEATGVEVPIEPLWARERDGA